MAGGQVKRATETLVKAAQQASAKVEEDEPFMAPKVGWGEGNIGRYQEGKRGRGWYVADV